MTSTPNTQANRLVRPGSRTATILAVIVLVPIALHNLWDYVEVRRLVSEVDAIRAKGEPVVAEQRTDGDHAAGRRYLAASVLVSRPPSDEISRVREWVAGVGPAPPRELTDRISAVVDESRDALTLADTGGDRSFDGFPVGTDFVYRTFQLGSLSQVLSARTISRSLDGQGDAAVDSALLTLKIRRALQEVGWPLIAEHDVPAILSFSRPSSESLMRLQAALETEVARDELLERLLYERARLIEAIWRRYYGTDPLAPSVYTLPLRSFTETLWRPWFSHQTVNTLRIWAEMIEAARRPWPEKGIATANVIAKYHLDSAPSVPGAIVPITLVLAESYPTLRATETDTLIADRASLVAIAVERYRRDHGDTLPTGLRELSPQYLSTIPLDPLSGSPLLYISNPDAYIVYSVGLNKQDDHGDLVSESRAAAARGMNPRFVRGGDIGVRVLLRH